MLEPTAVPVVTIADLALGTPELSTLAGSRPIGTWLARWPIHRVRTNQRSVRLGQQLLGRLDGDQTLTTVT
jgi:hypothetical protein